ncbi:MAG: bifunctional 5,10-methylenetetrahydrofolate dehydrogenase/5,10-methenyltetrahydrofolate cyclohydrolase [Candidatus Marinimicrobia bacterium]|jgi:methylenetetrahydrofolate dehydrogenase (NADP+)/methenyltetrahydrofolate cyclohydrolase|nr:bifunctional 5,10-methylenetetrahydrofolate dehydrogenase/5,10-methenyltetrahydrofolate cyclohydrolase [bacterium]MDG1223564.1 bifunctional 5,10-methylenetetrahydrofolate dehydrogenase/5,10-methenyltetrahydrofolate cyclohydrolase [Candidatus Neomarinimicrobiota bacterium]
MHTSKVLSGKDTAVAVYASFKNRLDILSKKGIIPGLCVILVGDDPASQIYVKTKSKKLQSLGLRSKNIYLNNDVSQNELIQTINGLNQDSNYHGILVQMPLPSHIDSQLIINSIDSTKDVDGFHPENVGWLSIGKPRFIPCTPKGIMKIFKHYNIELSGKDIVVIGRSNIVGRPMSILVSSNGEWSNGTCTICHSRTKNLEQYTRNADVVISAIGKPNYLKADMIKKGSIIIDVGINRVEAENDKGYKIIGDVDYNSVIDKVSFITPVPGGVGPMTIAMLVENTIEAAEQYIP